MLEPRQGNQFGSCGGGVSGGEGVIWRQLFCLGASGEEKNHGVAPMKAREASAAFSARPLIETCRCFEVAQNS